jgi:hypothetical protein
MPRKVTISGPRTAQGVDFAVRVESSRRTPSHEYDLAELRRMAQV